MVMKTHIVLMIMFVNILNAQGIIIKGFGRLYDRPDITDAGSNPIQCLPSEQRTAIIERVKNLNINFGLRTDTLEFIQPISGGITDSTNSISNYVDNNVSSGIIDYSCNYHTYNGHNGTDFAIPLGFYGMDEMTTPVLAAADGIVVETHDGEYDRNYLGNSAMSNYVVIYHTDDIITIYLHFKRYSLQVAYGDTVMKGDIIGYVGSSGASTGPHLHFEVSDTNLNVLDPWYGNCNTISDSYWEEQIGHIGTMPQIAEAVTPARTIDPNNYWNSVWPTIINAPPDRKHVQVGGFWWSYIGVQNLYAGDTLKWHFYRNGVFDSEYFFVPSELTQFWPIGYDVLNGSDWYSWGEFTGDPDTTIGEWTQEFYINSNLWNTIDYVCDTIPNQSATLDDTTYFVELGVELEGILNSYDPDGTPTWHTVVPGRPLYGTFELFGGYMRRFKYIRTDPNGSSRDTVMIRVRDDSYGLSNVKQIVFEATNATISKDNLPAGYALEQNYPNPFNPETRISFKLAEKSHVSITIYDMLGRNIKTLINQTQDAGYKSLIWDATNDYGEPVSAGIYLYQIQAGEYISTKKMVLLK